jgi:hypothetical protein
MSCKGRDRIEREFIWSISLFKKNTEKDWRLAMEEFESKEDLYDVDIYMFCTRVVLRGPLLMRSEAH